MGDADREDAKSLDSSDGGAAAENNSDMVHLEEEEEDEELQTSVLDLQLSSEEFKQIRPPTSLPVFRLEPPSATSTPPPSAEEPPYAPPGLLPPSSVLPPVVTRDVPSEEDSKAASPADLPALLCGGAALVAAVGVMAYCAVAYCKK